MPIDHHERTKTRRQVTVWIDTETGAQIDEVLADEQARTGYPITMSDLLRRIIRERLDEEYGDRDA